MVTKLTDNKLGNQSGAGVAAGNRSQRRRRTRDPILAIAASVLGPHMLVPFQLSGYVFENGGHIFAKKVFNQRDDTVCVGGPF